MGHITYHVKLPYCVVEHTTASITWTEVLRIRLQQIQGEVSYNNLHHTRALRQNSLQKLNDFLCMKDQAITQDDSLPWCKVTLNVAAHIGGTNFLCVMHFSLVALCAHMHAAGYTSVPAGK